MLCLQSTFFRLAQKITIINCHYLSIHSIIPHGLLVWRMMLFLCLTKFFKVGSDCKQLNFNVKCNIQSVMIFRFCSFIPWKSSFAPTSCGKQKKFEHWTFRHLQIFLKKTAPEFNMKKLTELLFQASIRCSIYQTLIILQRHTVQLLWNTI